MVNFPENKGDSRKLEKVEELIQNFSEQCSGGSRSSTHVQEV